MMLPDVNVLVYAYDEGSPQHARFHEWLTQAVQSQTSYALSDLVLSWFVRVVTHPRVFVKPSPLERALEFVSGIREQPNCVPVAPSERHWEIFVGLCRDGGVTGNLVPDACLAALAIESGSELITADRGFGRFPGLRWRHPLD